MLLKEQQLNQVEDAKKNQEKIVIAKKEERTKDEKTNLAIYIGKPYVYSSSMWKCIFQLSSSILE